MGVEGSKGEFPQLNTEQVQRHEKKQVGGFMGSADLWPFLFFSFSYLKSKGINGLPHLAVPHCTSTYVTGSREK